jgi:hypothetical protein
MRVHIWEESDGFYWDDAEDHGGYDRNVPCGPFSSEERAVLDACSVCDLIEIIDGKPWRYGVMHEV